MSGGHIEMEDWAKTIRDVRKEKSWTQTELARKMRVSTNSISKWEKGYGEPSMESRKKLKRVLDEDENNRDIEIIKFIYVLIDNISDKKLNDERMHIICGNGKDCGNLKEYICERMKTLLGASVVFGEEKKE